ncbi:MAG: hypothetical protein AAF747_00290 [Planctomycetota bacterium]
MYQHPKFSFIPLGLLACGAIAQSVRVYVETPESAAPGSTITATVKAEMLGFDNDAAIAAFGFDLLSVGDDAAVDSISPATIPTLTFGARPGTEAGNNLLRVVGGQPADVFGLNPSVDRSNPMTLFTVEVTLDNYSDGSSVTLAPVRPDYRGGVIIYPDASRGRSVVAPAAVDLIFEPVTFDVVSPCNTADVSTPFGTIDYYDAAIFLDAIAANDDAADLTSDGTIDDADVFAFVSAAALGCSD